MLSPSAPSRLAVIGCGAAARACHLPALAEGGPFRLTHLVDTVPAHTHQAADIYRAACATARTAPGEVALGMEPADILPEIDAAIIATPHATHFPLADTLLRAGKHVLLEKPLALTTEDCGRIAAAARAGKALAMPAHVRRLFPAAPWVRRTLAEGRLGRVTSVTWREGHPYAWPLLTGFMFAPPDEGGGVLLDTGPHVLDLLHHWFPGPAEVVSCAHNGGTGAESEIRLHATFGGTPSEIHLSRLRSLGDTCTLHGTTADLTVSTGFPGTYELRNRDGALVAEGAIPLEPPARDTWVGLFSGQLEQFAGAIARHTGTPGAPGDDTRSAATLAEAETAVRLLSAARDTARDADGTPLPRPAEGPLPAPQHPPGRIAVTGASGFIGSHLTQRLVTGGSTVTAVVRDLAKLAPLSHLAGPRLRPHRADIRDADALAEAFRGCDTVVHTVHGGEGTPEEQWSVGVDGTRAALAAARRAGVRRFVHVSTVAVYDDKGRSRIDESTPRLAHNPGARDYAHQKLAAEELVLASGSDGLTTAVVQPTVVYGPGSPAWTLTPLRRLREGRTALPTGDEGGTCNAVHVSDVADALIAAATRPAPEQARMLVSGPATLPWGRFYDAYRELLGTPEAATSGAPPEEWERALYDSHATVSTDAVTAFGCPPRTDFRTGFAHTAAWARWAGIVQ
ncbi:NAD-dependent epimerase/dehydratase family protein [Streptomyces daliensis]